MPTKSEKSSNRLNDWLLSVMHRVSPRMSVINICASIVAVILAISAILIMRRVLAAQAEADHINEVYQNCQTAVNQLQETSDFLTSEARQYVASGNRVNLDNYLAEVETYDHRGIALNTLREQASNDEAVAALEEARNRSDQLAQTELYALRLKAEAEHLDSMPQAIANVVLDQQDTHLSDEQKSARASDMLNGDAYAQQKFGIYDQVNSCTELLVGALRNRLNESNEHLNKLFGAMDASVTALLLTVLFVIGATRFLLLWPMSIYEQNIRNNEALEPGGARELRYLTAAYNDMYELNHSRAETLDHEAHHDALTGLLNRGAFDELLTLHKHNCALLLVDVDLFKQFNDEYGHDMGDAILVEVAATLYGSFRSTDHICRIGGDEFAVIMTNVGPNLKSVIAHKLKKIAAFLRDTSNGLPAATISVGVAFGKPGYKDDELFQLADGALYQTKERGRDGFTFADDES